MKISTSSIILATLAISSSSSSLAAPAGDFEDAGFSPSSSMHSVHHGHPSSATHASSSVLGGRSDTFVKRSPSPANSALDPQGAVSGLLQDVKRTVGAIPVVGPPLSSILDKVLLAGQATENISQQEVAAFTSAADEVKRILNQINQTMSNTPASQFAPAQNAASANTNTQNVGDDPSAPSKSISDSPAPTEAAEAADAGSNATAGTTYYSSASASPAIPSNPPNTPSLPVNLPTPAHP